MRYDTSQFLGWAQNNTIFSTQKDILLTPKTNTNYQAISTCDTFSFSVNVHKKPTPFLPKDTSVCSGEIISLYAEFSTPDLTYIWQNGSRGGMSIDKPGTYTVFIKNNYLPLFKLLIKKL